jgi:hypothetical protein
MGHSSLIRHAYPQHTSYLNFSRRRESHFNQHRSDVNSSFPEGELAASDARPPAVLLRDARSASRRPNVRHLASPSRVMASRIGAWSSSPTPSRQCTRRSFPQGLIDNRDMIMLIRGEYIQPNHAPRRARRRLPSSIRAVFSPWISSEGPRRGSDRCCRSSGRGPRGY